MPTEEKVAAIAEIKGWLERCTIAITTDYSGLAVADMTILRRALREQGVEYRVVKNTLTYRAADEANLPVIRDIVHGPTGIAFGYGEPTEPAKALSEYIRANRSSLKILGAMLDGRELSPADVETLARLPSRDQLISQLLGQMQAPIAGLARVLNGPISGLARVLQAYVDKQNEPSGSSDQS